MPGTFIVLEGPDGSGTTTHAQLLAKRLQSQGHDVVLTAEPTDGSIGLFVRETIKESTETPSPEAIQLLFCADRAQHVSEVIKPALDRGKSVLCDRYILSTLVYGKAHGVDGAWLQSINDHFPKPDVTIITLPPFDVCIERLEQRGRDDLFEHELMQQHIYEGYKEAGKDSDVIMVDTSGNEQEAAEYVWKQVEQFLRAR